MCRFVGFGIFKCDFLHEDLQLVPEETSAWDRFCFLRLATNVRVNTTINGNVSCCFANFLGFRNLKITKNQNIVRFLYGEGEYNIQRFNPG